MMDFPVTFFMFRCGSWAHIKTHQKRINFLRFHNTKIVRARYRSIMFPETLSISSRLQLPVIYLHPHFPTDHVYMYVLCPPPFPMLAK